MVSDRLKDFIFKKLYKDLSRVEIIHYKTYIWFIDREDKCWYFRYDKSNGTLLWRYYFFMDFFTLFTMSSIEFVPIISSWVEQVINNKVTITRSNMSSLPNDIENALNCKMVEEVINHKVSFDLGYSISTLCEVEDVLNHKVTKTWTPSTGLTRMVEDVLNHKVTKTDGVIALYNPIQEHHKVGLTLGPSLPQYEMVDEVLNYKVTKTASSSNQPSFVVDDVLNYKVTKTDGAIAWNGPIEEALNNKVNTTEDEIDNNIRNLHKWLEKSFNKKVIRTNQ